jgi:hypothetical protein
VTHFSQQDDDPAARFYAAFAVERIEQLIEQITIGPIMQAILNSASVRPFGQRRVIPLLPGTHRSILAPA